MKPALLCGIVFSLAGLVLVPSLSAQRPAPAPPRTRAPYVVDTSSIVQNAVRLKQAMEALKTDYKAKAEELKKEGQQGNQLTEKARSLPGNSPERKDLEQQVLKLRTEFELHGKRVNDDTRERETQIVYGLVTELNEEVSRFAQANGQQIILRYDPPQQSLDNARAILAEIQRPIVYQRGLDVTPVILEAINRRGPAASTARSQPGARPPAGRSAAPPARNPVR